MNIRRWQHSSFRVLGCLFIIGAQQVGHNSTPQDHLIFSAGNSFELECIAFSPDGQYLVSGGWGSSMMLWDTKSNKCIARLEGNNKPVLCVAWRPDGNVFAAAGRDKTIILWDATKRQILSQMKTPGFSINSLAFSPDGKTLATGAEDGSIMLWDTTTGKSTVVAIDQGFRFTPSRLVLTGRCWHREECHRQ